MSERKIRSSKGLTKMTLRNVYEVEGTYEKGVTRVKVEGLKYGDNGNEDTFFDRSTSGFTGERPVSI